VIKVIVVLKEFKGRKWVIKFVKSVDIVVVEGDRDIRVRMNGKVLKF